MSVDPRLVEFILAQPELRAIVERTLHDLGQILLELQASTMEAADLGEFNNRARDWLRP